MTNSGSEMGFLESAEAITKTVEAVENLGKAFEALAKMFDAQREFDKLRAQLTFVTGSVGDAALAFKDLQSLAAATPFSVEETAKAFIKLRMAGLDPSEKALRAYGNTAAGLGESLDKVVGAVADAAQGNFEELEKLGISAEKNGGRVSLTFQGATESIGNNAKEIEAYLQKLAKTKFGDAMAVQSDTLDGAIGNLHDAWSAFTLSLSQAGLGDAARAAIEAVTDALKAFREHADAIVSGLKVAAEIGAAYFAVFVAGPAVVTAVTTVFAALEQQVLLVRLAMAIGASTTDVLTNSFGGMSVSAQLAEGSLSKVKLAGGLMMAAFAGWEIGSWLNDNFVEARLAGLAFVEVTLTGWEHLKYGAQMAWEFISFAWDKSVSEMQKSLAVYLAAAAKGFSMIGATGIASSIDTYVAKLDAAAAGQKSFAERTRDITKAHQDSVAAIHKNVDELAQSEIANEAAEQAKKKKGLTGGLGSSASGTSAKSNVQAASGHRQAAAPQVRQDQQPDWSLGISNDELFGRLQDKKGERDAEVSKQINDDFEKTVKQDRFDRHLQDLNAMVESMSALDQAAQSAAKGMADAFGSVGKAIGGMTTALTGYERTQATIAAKLASATNDAGGDKTKIERANQVAAEETAQAQIKSYGDMAGAAKGFFKEKSAGYKLLAGMEKEFHLIQLAFQMESLYTHLFVTGAKATATVSGQGVETGAVAAGETARNASKIPGVFLSFMSALGPWGTAAAAAAIAAVLGGAFGGGGKGGGVNPNSAEERQKVQGTGTVLGDSKAKSESIANSLEIMKKNSELALGYQNSMLTALKNIASALGGAAKGILQTAGITGGSAFGTVASSDKAFVGASHTKDITDSGVQFSGTFGQLRSGHGTGRQYEDVYTTSDGGMFRSGWTRTDTNYKALSAEAMKPFSLIFDNMGDLLVDAGVKLGQDSASLTRAINNINVDFGVSLRGLKGQDLTDALNAGVSVAFDKVTTQLFPTIAQFQKMGEGLGETLVRVASDVQGVNSVFASMGKPLGSMSLEAKERLVEASGGLDEFASSAKSFMQNFYTEAEQRDATKAKLNPVLAQYGLSTEGPNAQKMFRDFVVGLDASTQAGAQTYAMLMNLQQAFFDVTDAVASERNDLQDQLDELTMTSTQLLAKQRDALDDSNKALFDQVQAAKQVKDAQDAAKTSLGNFVSQMQSFATTATGLNSSLVLGSLSTLTPEQQYVEARRQFEQTRQQAAAGDKAAQGNLQSTEQTFLQMSQKINGGDAQYSSDLATVMQANDQLAQWATQSADVAQASLDALNDSAATLADISATLTAIAQGVQYLPAALAGQDLPAFTQSSTQIDYARMGTMDMAPLVAEVKALRDEVKGLRAEALKRTGDLIQAGEASAEKAADIVVEGVRNAATDSAWSASNSKRIVS